MSITNHLKMLESYASLVPAEGADKSVEASDALSDAATAAGVDLDLIAASAEASSSSSIDGYLDEEEGQTNGSSLAEGDPEQLLQWHKNLAGAMAGEIESAGFTVNDVHLGEDFDIFEVEVKGVPVQMTISAAAHSQDLIAELRGLSQVLYSDAAGGVLQCTYVPGKADTQFVMNTGGDVYADSSIRVADIATLSVEQFQRANVVCTALENNPPARDDDAYFSHMLVRGEDVFAVGVKDGREYFIVVNPENTSVTDITENFNTELSALIEAEAAQSGGTTQALSSGQAAETGGGLDDLPAQWAVANAAGQKVIMQQIFTALNANGGTLEGKAQNLKGIEILGKLAGSEKAASILSQIAINAAKPDSGYNAEYSQAARNALVALNNASPGNAKIAQFADDIDKKIT